MKMQYLVNPAQQDREWAEQHKPRYSALCLPELYRADPDLIALAKSGNADEIRFRIDQNLSNPNIVMPDKLDHVKDGWYFFFIEERSPLVAAVENGHMGVFDLLMGYLHVVDVNVVCCEWSLNDCYKRFTALDAGKVAYHASAKAMVERLIAVGGQSAEHLPAPSRENPFRCWKSHFPNEDVPEGLDSDHANSHMQDLPPNMTRPSRPGRAASGARSGPSPPPPPRPPPPSGGRRATHQRPPLPTGGGSELLIIVTDLQRRLDAAMRSNADAGRQQMLRQLFLEWHPDKRPNEQELATKVFQWLQDVKAFYA